MTIYCYRLGNAISISTLLTSSLKLFSGQNVWEIEYSKSIENQPIDSTVLLRIVGNFSLGKNFIFIFLLKKLAKKFWFWFLFWVAKILYNCLKIVSEKSISKSWIKEISYFPHPFSGKQHQNLFTSEILQLHLF